MFAKNSLTMPGDYDLRVFDVLDSSNAECRRIVEQEGATGNIWVVAGSQTMGRGRRGRTWESPNGNIYASLLYGIDCDLAAASGLSFVAALAVRDTVADILQAPDRVSCKWPNDILVEGRKISGILLETAGPGHGMPSHVIIGIGINVSHHPEDSLYPATDLNGEAGRKIAREQVTENLMLSLAHWISRWESSGFPPIRKAWKACAHGVGEDIVVRLPGEELCGRFVDLDKAGALILEFDGKRRHITAGDIFFTQG